MKNIQVGATVKVSPSFMPGEITNGAAPKQSGKVTWIHPAGRFALVTFDSGCRECYWMDELLREAVQ